MNDEIHEVPSIAAAITGRVVRKTVLIAGTVALAAFGYAVMGNGEGRPWAVPAGILFGGALGIVNFRWLARAVERLYLRKGSPAAASITAAEIVHVLKLFAVFIILFVVIKWQVVNLIGLIIGLSLCFAAIIWEGLTAMRELHQKN